MMRMELMLSKIRSALVTTAADQKRNTIENDDKGNKNDDDNDQQQQQQYDLVATKGAENGLFRACMHALRQSHESGNRLRLVLVVAGLFTDRKVYREVLACFYLLTKHLELALVKDSGNPICEKIRQLGYHFTPQYEADLEYLFATTTDEVSSNSEQLLWSMAVDKIRQRNLAVGHYITQIDEASRTGDACALAGAAFVLYGALIIGGGAVAMPRVKSAYGPQAIHLFQDVTGPGREARKRAFIATWDSLVVKSDEDDNNSAHFHSIVDAAGRFMKGNNDVMTSLSIRPWWLWYPPAFAVAFAAMLLAYLYNNDR